MGVVVLNARYLNLKTLYNKANIIAVKYLKIALYTL